MKRSIVAVPIFALTVGSVPAAFAQGMGGEHAKGMEMSKDEKSEATRHKAVGTVTRFDQISGKVTIAHGPVQSLRWPAMTMSFLVKDKALLERLSSRKEVEFEFVQQGRDYVIVSAK